jgi:DHA2 family multidrug resistance protein-like MFS transporter
VQLGFESFDQLVGESLQPNEQRASARDWAGLTVLAFAMLLIPVDATVLGLAVPAISADLGPTGTQLLWVIDVCGGTVAPLDPCQIRQGRCS